MGKRQDLKAWEEQIRQVVRSENTRVLVALRRGLQVDNSTPVPADPMDNKEKAEAEEPTIIRKKGAHRKTLHKRLPVPVPLPCLTRRPPGRWPVCTPGNHPKGLGYPTPDFGVLCAAQFAERGSPAGSAPVTS
ncbi:hypothetical protein [Salinithrix halophila]|uniref:Uncharacterized protein n=1 Tax=Salinithrix halophila TaxID=1485204 RepID=A0ABV8JFM6_9BACL